ncbi:MAG: AI-2E family transporter [Streptosporangiales bacterium]|nr:AI-2E family transporter [Streptosporangiales bacterium]
MGVAFPRHSCCHRGRAVPAGDLPARCLSGDRRSVPGHPVAARGGPPGRLGRSPRPSRRGRVPVRDRDRRSHPRRSGQPARGRVPGHQRQRVAGRGKGPVVVHRRPAPPQRAGPEPDRCQRAPDDRAEPEPIASGALATATLAAEIVAGLLLALFVTFFFLYDGARIWRWCVRLFPRAARAHVAAAGQRAWTTLVSYVRGIVLVAAFDAALTAILLLALRVPLVAPLSMLVFVGAFVPMVGAFLSGAVAVLVALVSNGLITALLVVGGMIAIQMLEGHLLQPLLLGRMVRMHPVAVILVVTAGAVIGGIAGAIIAVPLAAVLNVVIRYFADVAERPPVSEGSSVPDGSPTEEAAAADDRSPPR